MALICIQKCVFLPTWQNVIDNFARHSYTLRYSKDRKAMITLKASFCLHQPHRSGDTGDTPRVAPSSFGMMQNEVSFEAAWMVWVGLPLQVSQPKLVHGKSSLEAKHGNQHLGSSWCILWSTGSSFSEHVMWDFVGLFGSNISGWNSNSLTELTDDAPWFV